MNRKKIIVGSAAFVLILISGGLFFSTLLPGDGVLTVTGRVVGTSRAPADSCLLELHYADDSQIAGFALGINDVFKESFVISPRRTRYYLRVESLRDSSIFETPVFKAGGGTYARKPLDLGTIVLKSRD